MKAQATPSKKETRNTPAKAYRSQPFHRVFDGREQPIRGLWRRGDNFVARLTVEDEQGIKKLQWKRLEGAQTVPQAQKALAVLLGQRDTNSLPTLKRTPKLADYSKKYFEHYALVKDAKRPATIAKEKTAMSLWCAHMGETRVDRITKAQINAFIGKRQGAGMVGSTVNGYMIALRNVLRKAIDDGYLQRLPTENIRPLKWTPPKRTLATVADFERLCAAALNPDLKNGRQLADYLRLMAYTGARRCEALRLRWADVDFEREQITIGADGLAKNGDARTVDLYPKLAAHLQDMFARRQPDSQFLFPSPLRGDRDFAAKTFIDTLHMARTAAGMTAFSFHDCRHFFISFCVMSGIDFMTIARWAGHKDGGVLIGKVYGHLSNEHAKQQAQRINFEPQVLPAIVAA